MWACHNGIESCGYFACLLCLWVCAAMLMRTWHAQALQPEIRKNSETVRRLELKFDVRKDFRMV